MKLLQQTKSRKQPKLGDIFKLRLDDHTFRVGKVLATEVDPYFLRPAAFGLDSLSLWIVGIYSTTISNADVSSHDVSKTYLVPPCIINRQGWLQGFFETCDNAPMTEFDAETTRYWRDESANAYYDIDWLAKSGRIIEPPDSGKLIGRLSIGNHLTIEEQLARTLS
jgi:hypothetical protein